MSTNELHVVFGSGPVGLAVMDELVARKRRVQVVNRSGRRNGHIPEGVDVVKGDATDPNSTRQICKEATHVYNCTNAPDYHKWPDQFPPLQAGVLAGAAENEAKLIVMENTYIYGPHNGVPMTEDLPHRGQGLRSSTRVQMTRDLFQAHRRGQVRVVTGRASDFFGPRVHQSVMGEPIMRAALRGKKARVPVSADQPHTYTYIPDVGKALVILGQHDEALGQAWHIPSPQTVTTREFLDKVYRAAGNPPEIQVTSKWLMRITSLFVPPLRGIDELAYEFEESFILDHNKFVQTFGNIATPLDEAIRTTVDWYRQTLNQTGEC